MSINVLIQQPGDNKKSRTTYKHKEQSKTTQDLKRIETRKNDKNNNYNHVLSA
jgi:hypothetical protein